MASSGMNISTLDSSSGSPSDASSISTNSSWNQISKTVRAVDGERVKDCKEDIDTILVFAGLFSAVMTAFLVESYQTLRPDPQDTVISLLQQLVVQTSTFAINNNFINSTSHRQATLSLPNFQPSTNAQRVNVLWFSSLTLSLVSASFGIIVKQWLREFLAGEHSSPRAHLRIRHFRNPGLSYYRVFDIAAILPLLLQLSLALFFVGLCFFTADVHSSIGHTTLPLVAAWGFLFVAVTSVPVFDPTCPYRLPVLRRPISEIRKLLFNRSTGVERHQDDEERAAHNDAHDVDILIEALKIDAIQADDELLKSTMLEALQQASIRPEQLFRFPFAVIDHRMQPGTSAKLSTTVLDMKGLSRQTYTTIMHMIAQLVDFELKRLPVVNHKSGLDIATEGIIWLEHSLCALLSDSIFPHSETVNQVIYTCLSEGRHNRIAQLIRSRDRRLSDPAFVELLLRRLEGGLAMVKSTKELLDILHNGPLTKATDRLPFAFPMNCEGILHNLLVPRIKCDNARGFDTILAIDSLLDDDKLLAGAMWEALKDEKLPADELYTFLLRAVGNRTGYDAAEVVRTSLLDVKNLSQSTYTLLTDMISQLIVQEFGHRDTPESHVTSRPSAEQWSDALAHAICVLLSPSNFPQTDIVHEALRLCLSNDNYSTKVLHLIHSRIDWRADLSLLFPVLQRLKGAMALLTNLHGELASLVGQLFHPVLYSPHIPQAPSGQVRDPTVSPTTPQLRAWELNFSIPENCQPIIINLFIARLTQGIGEWENIHRQRLLIAVLELSGGGRSLGARFKIVHLVKKLFISPDVSDARVICSIAFRASEGLDLKSGEIREFAQRLILDAGADSSAEERYQMLSRLGLLCRKTGQRPSTEVYKTSSTDLDPVLICHLCIRLLAEISSREEETQPWTQLFDSVLTCFTPSDELFSAYRSGQYKSTVQECLRLIQAIEPTWGASLRTGDMHSSIIPEKLVFILRAIRDNTWEALYHVSSKSVLSPSSPNLQPSDVEWAYTEAELVNLNNPAAAKTTAATFTRPFVDTPERHSLYSTPTTHLSIVSPHTQWDRARREPLSTGAPMSSATPLRNNRTMKTSLGNADKVPGGSQSGGLHDIAYRPINRMHMGLAADENNDKSKSTSTTGSAGGGIGAIINVGVSSSHHYVHGSVAPALRDLSATSSNNDGIPQGSVLTHPPEKCDVADSEPDCTVIHPVQLAEETGLGPPGPLNKSQERC